MTDVSFRCPGCRAAIRMRAVHAGRQVACPRCGRDLVVPGHRAAGHPQRLAWALEKLRAVVWGVYAAVMLGAVFWEVLVNGMPRPMTSYWRLLMMACAGLVLAYSLDRLLVWMQGRRLTAAHRRHRR